MEAQMSSGLSDERTSQDPFDADGATWQSVSSNLALGRRLTALLAVGIVTALVLGGLWLGARNEGWFKPVFAGLGVLVLIDLIWEWWLIGRQVSYINYAERSEELLVRKGMFFRRIVVVPYGRLQYVEVQAGPLARKLGYADLQLHTASAASDATIPGVPTEQAAVLRDRLTARGQAHLAGL